LDLLWQFLALVVNRRLSFLLLLVHSSFKFWKVKICELILSLRHIFKYRFPSHEIWWIWWQRWLIFTIRLPIWCKIFVLKAIIDWVVWIIRTRPSFHDDTTPCILLILRCQLHPLRFIIRHRRRLDRDRRYLHSLYRVQNYLVFFRKGKWLLMVKTIWVNVECHNVRLWLCFQ
jgi:hypothetical protein